LVCRTATLLLRKSTPYPSYLPFITKQLLEQSMTDFVDNIVFIKGQIIDIESWASKDSTFQATYQYAIPKYELYFELRDTTIGIKSYCICLSMDQYGQIISFDWPREYFNKRSNFKPGYILKNEAVKYAVKKHYKTRECIYDLVFDDYQNRLYWRISFLQQSKETRSSGSKDYITIVIDALSLKIIEEYETSTWSISCTLS